MHQKQVIKYLFYIFLFNIVSCRSNTDVVPQKQLTNFANNSHYICKMDTSIKSNVFGSKSALTESQTKYYFDIWKELFLEDNKLSASFFDNHIKCINLSSFDANNAIILRVAYVVQIDWWSSSSFNQFPVKIHTRPNTDAYKHLNIPNDIFLDKPQIANCLKHHVESHTNKINNNATLKYLSCEEACEAFSTISGYKKIFPSRPTLTAKSILQNGYPSFLFEATIDASKNECLRGSLNLVTGSFTINNHPCEIN